MNHLNLLHLQTIPDGLLDIHYTDLHRILPSPTLLDLPGRHPEPLFISVLLHGNEPTGFQALQLLLKRYRGKQLPRALVVFIGNIAAAKQNVRRLENQPDYNRIWPGTETLDCAETALANEVFQILKLRKTFASVDVHNNTGMNPHYACINSLENPFLQLASLFGRLVVYFTRPKGVQSAAFAQICPSVTLECGRPGQQQGVKHALEFLDSCLHLTEFPKHPVHPQDIDLFHTVAQVKVKDEINFSFQLPDADLLFYEDIEKMNFTEIAAGTVWGIANGKFDFPLIAQDEEGNDVTEKFFCLKNNLLQIKRAAMPSMLTLDEKVIRQDCFCYLMERLTY